MSPGSYLRDHVLHLILWAGALAASALFLLGLGTDTDAVWFVEILYAAAFWIPMAWDYFKRTAWLRQMHAQLESLDRKFLLSVVLEPGDFAEAQLFEEALREITQDMNDEIAAHTRARSEYREYLELWIHEIKTPIAAAMLAAGNNPSPAMRAVKHELRRIESYVMQALYYARSAALEKDYLIEKTSLEKLVDDALRRNAPELIAGSFAIEKDLGSDTVYTDSKWLGFVLDQILQNAAKYHGDGPGFLRFASRSGTAAVELMIEDRGIGVPDSDLPRLFEKGFTGAAGRKYGRSTGMGLYISRKLLHKMGGSLRAEHGKRGGLMLVLRLPASRMYNFTEKA